MTKKKTNPITLVGGVAHIGTTNNETFFVDRSDVIKISGRYWGIMKMGNNHKYVCTRMYSGGECKVVMLHRFIMGAQKGQDVDHLDGNGLNNMRSNLRVCSHAENGANRRKIAKSASVYKGLTRCGGGWCVRIKKDYKSHYIGCFKNESEAATAYNDAAKKYFGAFAKLNEVKI